MDANQFCQDEKKNPFSQEKGQSVGRIGFKSWALSCDNDIHSQFLFEPTVFKSLTSTAFILFYRYFYELLSKHNNL